MGVAGTFEPEKLIIGIMYKSPIYFQQATEVLVKAYGEIDTVSDEYIFSEFSNFYNNEMNGIVLKRFISFCNCVNPANLAKIKFQTNAIENEFAVEKNRIVNIDPCLLGHGKFVMATTKPASFRIPLQKGIYADLSLVYAKGDWVHFFWTYFDVKSTLVKRYLRGVRKRYLEQRKAEQY